MTDTPDMHEQPERRYTAAEKKALADRKTKLRELERQHLANWYGPERGN